jgi:hypothetical protein
LKHASVLIIEDRIAIGGADEGKPSKWCRIPSLMWALSRSLPRNCPAPVFSGSRPKISSQATSMKLDSRPTARWEFRDSGGFRLVAVDECDGAFARAGVSKTGIEVIAPVSLRSLPMSMPTSPSLPVTTGSSLVFSPMVIFAVWAM